MKTRLNQTVTQSTPNTNRTKYKPNRNQSKPNYLWFILVGKNIEPNLNLTDKTTEVPTLGSL